MLDILRKHAASTLIKIIFGMIIVSFAFFFGYNRIQKAGRRVAGLGIQAAAEVNGQPISAQQYAFLYEQIEQSMKSRVQKPEDVEQMQKFAKSMAMNQSIRRFILLEMAKNAGFKITDGELESFIRGEFSKDGEFDKNFYVYKYLPYFMNRYGINFETMAREDLVIEELGKDFSQFKLTENLSSKTPKWKFLVASFNATKSDKIKNIDTAKSAAAEVLRLSGPYAWKAQATLLGGEATEIGPIGIEDRNQLFAGAGDEEAFRQVFTLSKENPQTASAIVVGNTAYAIRLIERTEEDSLAMPKSFLESWLAADIDKAKVKVFIDK